MNNKKFENSYGIKEVPDVFICDEDGKILYYSVATKKMKLSQQANSCLWEGECEIAIGNLELWFNLTHDPKVKSIYFRTWKRDRETGEDVAFAIAINEPIFHDFEICLKPDEDPFTFPIKFSFAIGKLEIVPDEDAPNVVTTIDEKANITRTFIDPAHTLKELKAIKVKERLKELKLKRNGRSLND